MDKVVNQTVRPAEVWLVDFYHSLLSAVGGDTDNVDMYAQDQNNVEEQNAGVAGGRRT
ncbi:hypothetical protein ACFQ1L_35255 [Phytohabitans flavus]